MPLAEIVSCFKSASSGPIFVQQLHACYPDCAEDEGGWLLSKSASADILDLQRRNYLTIDDSEPLRKASMDWSIVGLMTTAVGAKTASVKVDFEWLDGLAVLLTKVARDLDEQNVAQNPPPAQPPASPAQAPPSPPPPAPVEPKFDQAEEMKLHSTWKQTGDKKVLGSLLSRYRPLIRRQASRYYGADLPPAAIDAEAKEIAIKAFQNYDPSQGVKLSTYVTSYMPKIRQFVTQYQNPVRMSEDVTLRMRSYKDAVDELADKHGRQPTAQEVADHRKWSVKDVGKLRTLSRGAQISETSDEVPMKNDGQRRSEIFLGYLYHELDGDQKRVLEHMYGLHGAPRLDTDSAIAQESKMDPARVTRVRGQIAEKIRSHIEQV